MRLKNDSGYNSYPDNNNNNIQPYSPSKIPNANDVSLDEYKKERKRDDFDDIHRIEIGSTRIKFNLHALTIWGFIIAYVISLFFMFSKTKSKMDDAIAAEPKTVEGFVKQLSKNKKKVETSNDGKTSTWQEKPVCTATYNFTVDGVTYSGQFDSVDEVELSEKVVIVYDPHNPNTHHLQTAEEASAKPRPDNYFFSVYLFKFLCAAVVEAAIFLVVYLKIRVRLVQNGTDRL